MNTYAAFAYKLQAPFELEFDTANHGRPMSLVIGDVSPSGDIIHEAQDKGRPDTLVVRKDDSGIFVTYGDLDASLEPNRITFNQKPDEGVLERSVLPLHRLLVVDDAFGLHGSAVKLGDEGVVFIGDSGVGKSSTANALVEQGHALLADDVTLIKNGAILPAPAYTRLWQGPEKVRSHVQGTEQLEVPIRAVVRLTRMDATPAAFQAYLPHVFVLSNPPAEWRKTQFLRLAEFARTNELKTFLMPVDPNGEPSHVDALLEGIQAW